jgi:hypothetical protein
MKYSNIYCEFHGRSIVFNPPPHTTPPLYLQYLRECS